MNPIIINFGGSDLKMAFESISLRTAFLLCGKATSAGDSYFAIYYNEYESRNKVEHMINMIEAYADKEDELLSDWDAEFIRSTLKAMNKIKHPAPADIIAKKKIIKYVSEVYGIASKPTRDSLLAHGLPQLEPLFKNQEGLTMHFVSTENHEAESEDYTPLSKILMRRVEDTDDEDLFCLPPEFFLADFLTKLSIGASAKSKEARKGKGYIQHCFSLPNLNRLTVLEMETIHAEIKQAAAPFLDRSLQWMKSVYAQADAADTSHFFDREILPATAEILHLLSENKLLNNVALQQNRELVVDVYLGEVTAEVIWDFYKTCKVITDETWTKLEQAKSEGLHLKRWPFMAIMTTSISSGTEENQDKAKKEEPGVGPVKKSISID
jgi:hypothetical protein